MSIGTGNKVMLQGWGKAMVISYLHESGSPTQFRFCLPDCQYCFRAMSTGQSL
jgi:hypothetical protein